MNRCIYYKDCKESLNFNGEEHIFPAGLGGIRKLPKGYVSDEVNTMFSKLEGNVLKDSYLALYRIFLGPGKRGKLNDRYNTKSRVGVISDLEEKSSDSYLGYIKKGEPCIIDQIAYTDEKVNLIFNSNQKNANEYSDELLDHLKNFESASPIVFFENSYDVNQFNVGIVFKGKELQWFVLCNEQTTLKNLVVILNNYIYSKIQEKEIEEVNSKTLVSLNINSKISYYERVMAKIALNFLADKFEKDFVFDSQFDSARDFILGKSDNTFVAPLKDKESLNYTKKVIDSFQLPPLSHLIFGSYIPGEGVKVIIQFYDDDYINVIYFRGKFDLCSSEIFGTICDWQNRKEMDLIKHIS
ncbi:hypothetical protein [Salipaludibacillus daqingensis]|uniref:hypothetical protein n=1 Tax=Salipaludibacillus daqingensis TaxID=3041001 RepID=UPI0024754D4F|nr:hypothetical protein [Salipaludibacillus daqingensis]